MSKQISNIVFTKNRPMQLDAYLTSLHKFLPAESIKTYILYKEELFMPEYEQLFKKFSNCIIVREQDFNSDFMTIINQIETKYTIFGVDDVIYFDSVNLDIIDKAFEENVNDIFGFSLRFGIDFITQYDDKIEQCDINGQKVSKINWKKGRSATTRYPFELCATLYKTDLVKNIINNSQNKNPIIKKIIGTDSFLVKNLKLPGLRRKLLKRLGFFFSPNTLESWNCRFCQKNKNHFPGFIYFQKNCAVAIQVNMVNTTTNNQTDTSAELTVEALNEKYQQGYRFDIDFVSNNKPTQTHCGKELFVITKP